jgi:heme/copper-type cytochrome/quinol oxidase subunit 2
MSSTNTTTTPPPPPTTMNVYDFLNTYIFTPTAFMIVLVIILVYYAFSMGLGNGSSSNAFNSFNTSSNNSNTSGIIIAVVLFILIVLIVLHYYFGVNISAYIKDIFTNKPTIVIDVDKSTYEPSTVPEIKFKKQVFNIPGNYYNYENAKALCQAYGSKLATYEQVEKSYNNGGEWCNYGWSDNQMALFPTQQKTYNKLQTIKGHENDCGRPGVNGGYIANPEVRFGVNCYGNKPKITDQEEDLMKTATPYPETAKDKAFQKRVDFWKNKVDEILVSPFNYNSWGSF